MGELGYSLTATSVGAGSTMNASITAMMDENSDDDDDEMELARKMSLHAAQGTADRETFIAMGGTGEEFDKVDVNGDGILDMHEIQSIVKNRKPQQTAKQRRAQYLFDQQQKVARDRLKDGKKKVVAASELLRQQATNSTHKELSEKEFQTAHQGRMGANGDGLSGGGPINMLLGKNGALADFESALKYDPHNSAVLCHRAEALRILADNLLPYWKKNLHGAKPTKGNIEKCEEDKQLFLRKGMADIDHLLRFGSEAESGDFVLAWRLRGRLRYMLGYTHWEKDFEKAITLQESSFSIRVTWLKCLEETCINTHDPPLRERTMKKAEEVIQGIEGLKEITPANQEALDGFKKRQKQYWVMHEEAAQSGGCTIS